MGRATTRLTDLSGVLNIAGAGEISSLVDAGQEDTSSPAAVAPRPSFTAATPWGPPEPAAPQLPFDGTVAVRHGAPAVRRTDLGVLGRHLAGVWSKGSVFGEELLGAREVLAVAAVMTAPSVMEAVALVGSYIGGLQDLREQAISRLVTEIGKFASYLDAIGVEVLSQVTPHHALDFIDQAVPSSAGGWAEPSISTQYLRRTAIRLFYRCAHQLHLASTDPTAYIRLPPRSARTTRPLGDDEEALGRIWSQLTLVDTLHPTAWAIAGATAMSTELRAARFRDVDLRNARLWLHGNEHKREPRWGQLTEWSVIQVERRLAVIGTDPDTPLITTASRNSGQAAACNAIRKILSVAGLRSDPGVKPSSLPAWAGRQVLNETGRIEDAAHAMGVRSLDQAAEIIGHDW